MSFDQGYRTYIDEHPRLTAEEERTLGEAIQAGKRAQRLANRQKERLTGWRRAVVEQVVSAAHEAIHKLVAHNQPLVIKVAARYYSAELDDLIQEGNIGLLRAAQDFDPAKGRFSTHAAFWIRRRIQLAAYKESDPGKPLRYASVSESAAGIEEPSLRVRSIDRGAMMDSDGARSETGSLLNAIADWTYAPGVDDEDPRIDDLREALARVYLTQQEREVINLRYGFDGDDGRTLDATGKAMGLTRGRIHQIETNALRKLRFAMRVPEPTSRRSFEEAT